MSNFNEIKADIIKLNREITSLFEMIKLIPGITNSPGNEWKTTSQLIEEQINEDIIRVAVVGSIKSGKSTFVNALLGGDYLKRGAGVVTSIVTRIRNASARSAFLDFKSWDEVNREINQAMALLPSYHYGQFDIRNADNRQSLHESLKLLSAEKLISHDTFDANSILLASYLKGYDKVENLISRKATAKDYEKIAFEDHRDFVSDDSLSVYLKDLELRIPFSHALGDNIEIADCQGNDSLNPLHLLMIQDYLLKTHLTVYILSSRTGIRQADLKFFSMLKKMGLMQNIVFVVNSDFNEHENLDDLKRLINRVADEISVVHPDCQLFTFSALFALLVQLGENISLKDRRKREQWSKDADFAVFSEEETERFFRVLSDKLNRDRFNLLLKKQLERLSSAAIGLDDWISINFDVFSGGSGRPEALFQKISAAQEYMNQLNSIMENTIEGSVEKIRKEIARDVDHFLDANFGDLIRDIHRFIEKYETDYAVNESELEGEGFSTALYMTFQKFKHDLDLYMAETVNPRLIQFIRQEEQKIRDFFSGIIQSYDVMAHDVFEKHEETLSEFGVSIKRYTLNKNYVVELEDIKKGEGIHAPSLASVLQYNAKIRAEAIMHFGLYKMFLVVKKIFKQKHHDENGGKLYALKAGIKRIKKETRQSIGFHLNDYKENLKFQYLFKLIFASVNGMREMLKAQSRLFSDDITNMENLAHKEQEDKAKAFDVLRIMEEELKKIRATIGLLQEKMKS